MKKFNLNQFYLIVYKLLGFSFLTAMVLGLVVYAFLLAFYAISDSWAAPLTMSPSQEKVLAYQPQVNTLEATLNKQKIDLATAQQNVVALSTQISELDALLTRMDPALKQEAAQAANTGAALSSLVAMKRQDVAQSQLAVADIKSLLRQTEAELAAKLITADVAASRRITLQQALNSATDAKAQLVQLEDTAIRQRQSAATYAGASSSLLTMGAVKQHLELKASKAQLTIQLESAKSMVTALTSAVKDSTRVLEVAKTSPYFKALKENVTVTFVPYDNLTGVTEGSPVYDCYLQVFACRKVGEVTKVYSAEEYARHPVFKTDLKGRLAEVKFESASNAESKIVFINRKPLFI